MNSAKIMLSRVADRLFWLSRYLERGEHVARLLDVHLNFMLEASNDHADKRLQELLDCLSAQIDQDCTADECLHLLTFSEENSASIIYNITLARQNARYVREQISSEMWIQINKLYLFIHDDVATDDWENAAHDFFLEVRERSHLFQGITDATMTHNQAWHFIQLGRYLERSLNLVQLLNVQFNSTMPQPDDHAYADDYFDLIATLKSVSAFEAYCKIYSPNPQAQNIIAFLLFDAYFPRSLRFCIEKIQHSLRTLNETTRRSTVDLSRNVGRLASMLHYGSIADIQSLGQYLQTIQNQINTCHEQIYAAYITYPIESELRL